MEVSEKLARYILALQSVYIAEVGMQKEDLKWRDELEATFPVLKQEREHREVSEWLWAIKIERDPRVVALRCKVAQFSERWKLAEVRHEDCGTYADGSRTLLGELDELKNKVQSELLLEPGVDVLIEEWRKETHGSGDKEQAVRDH
jgi:hypothetical protein